MVPDKCWVSETWPDGTMRVHRLWSEGWRVLETVVNNRHAQLLEIRWYKSVDRLIN